MTTEEKARAYDEALKIAQWWLNDPQAIQDNYTIEDAIQNIFPVLEESEDERIRKSLISLIETIGEYYISNETRNGYVAWLKKQKELFSPQQLQEHLDMQWEHIKQDMFDATINYDDDWHLIVPVDECDLSYGDKVKVLVMKVYDDEEKQKEQKPYTPKYRVGDVMRTKQETAEGITDGLPVIVSVDDNYYYCTNEKIPISEQEEYEFPPMNMRQKQAEWSEDDEQNLNVCLSYIKDEPLRSWLKDAIRVRYDKPVEWSEDDEKRIKQLIYDTEFIKAHYEKKKENLGEQFNNALIRDCDEQIAWLKSLLSNLKKKNEDVANLSSKEWSDEDEEMLGKVLECIRFAEDHYQLEKEETNGVSVKLWLLDHIIPQPKQEWSEDDEERLKAICTYLQDYPRLAKINDVKRFNEYCDWLKSLPERFNLQPKNEWSEEDEDRIRQIERIAQKAGCTEKLQEEIHDWLKSLRYQCLRNIKNNWIKNKETI